MSDGDFLSRWSRRKIQARKGEPLQDEGPKPLEAPAALPASTPEQLPPAVEPPLPPVESLTLESDFAPFMKPQVEGPLRNQALKTLFSDPRFNVMDGLDVYIDDYSKPDPLPPGWLEKMSQVARLGSYEPLPTQEEGEPESADESASSGPVEEGEPASPEPADDKDDVASADPGKL